MFSKSALIIFLWVFKTWFSCRGGVWFLFLFLFFVNSAYSKKVISPSLIIPWMIKKSFRKDMQTAHMFRELFQNIHLKPALRTFHFSFFGLFKRLNRKFMFRL